MGKWTNNIRSNDTDLSISPQRDCAQENIMPHNPVTPTGRLILSALDHAEDPQSYGELAKTTGACHQVIVKTVRKMERTGLVRRCRVRRMAFVFRVYTRDMLSQDEIQAVRSILPSDDWMTVEEVAIASGLPNSRARAVLMQNPGPFISAQGKWKQDGGFDNWAAGLAEAAL
jgi:hypothetical protein